MINREKILFFIALFFCVIISSAQEVSPELIKQAVSSGAVSQKQVDQYLPSQNKNTNQKEAEKEDRGSSSVRKYTEEREVKENQEKEKEKENIDIQNIVFGREIFKNENLTFSPDLNIPTPKNYILSAGDEIKISVWGNSDFNNIQIISPEGTINIPRLGLIFLSGLTIEKAEQRIKTEMSKIYIGLSENTDFISVTLGNIRSITINILGEVIAPGTYDLSSFATIFNALYVVGGVNDIGSLRTITLFRNNKKIVELDVYDYLLKGSSAANVRLESGDVIMVQPYHNIVKIEGNVKRKRLFELKDGETLADLITMSGGFTGDAYSDNVMVRRKSSDRYRISTVKNTEYNSFVHKDGDVVTVKSSIALYENRLIVSGAVWRPGEYELSDNINSVKTLIEQAAGLKGDEFIGRAQVIRLNPDFSKSIIAIDAVGIISGKKEDVLLQPEDVLFIPSKEDLREQYIVEVKGAVNKEITLPYRYNMTVEDAILLAGGLKESAAMVNVEVARRVKDPKSIDIPTKIIEVFNFTLNDNLSIGEQNEMFVLEPFDEIYVRFSPGYREQEVMKVLGEVKFRGEYSLEKRTTRLSDIIEKAGGVSSDAYLKGANLKRLISEEDKMKINTLLKLSQNNGGKDSVAISQIDLSSYSVGIDLEKALARPGSYDDIILEDGDVLYVPKLQSIVKISGAVVYANSVTFTGKQNLRYYLNQAGGYTQEARKKPIVVYANGKVARTKSFLFIKNYPKIEPGCEIMVTMKKQKNGNNLAEIMAITNTTSSIATLLMSVVSLFK